MKKLLTICLLIMAGLGAKAQTGALTLQNLNPVCTAYVSMYATSPLTGNLFNCDIQCVQVTLAPLSPPISWPNATAALAGMGILNQRAGGTATPVTAGIDPGFAWCLTQVQYGCPAAPSCSGAFGDMPLGVGGVCVLFSPPSCSATNWAPMSGGVPRVNVVVTY